MKSIMIVALLGMIAFYGVYAPDPNPCTAANAAQCTQQISGKTLKCCKSTAASATCATTEAECVVPASGLTAGDTSPGTPCDASKCIFGCCRADGKCGKAAECAAIQGPCNGTSCSRGCCDSNKVCLTNDLDPTANCKYCTGGVGSSDAFLVCPGVSTTGALRTGQCDQPNQCQFGCCNGAVCGTQDQCCGVGKFCAGYDFGTATCDSTKCQYGCCNGNKCGTQDQCCGVGKFCAGHDFGTATCDATKCQYGCCNGSKCGTSTDCASTSKSWIWWVVGGAAALLLLLIVVVIIIRRRRQRLLAGYQSSSNPYQQGY